jgi:UMF1 family MFS transporter
MPVDIMPAANRPLGNDVTPREAWAWAMYDFANSGYTTVVITAVFNAYFVAVVASARPGRRWRGRRRWPSPTR